MRNLKTEFLPHAANHLRKKLKSWHDTNNLQKSEQYSCSFNDIAKQFADDSIELQKSALNLNNLFLLLKSDYDNGQINFAMYKDFLKPLYELLVEGENEGKEPLNVLGLNTNLIVSELKKVGY